MSTITITTDQLNMGTAHMNRGEVYFATKINGTKNWRIQRDESRMSVIATADIKALADKGMISIGKPSAGDAAKLTGKGLNELQARAYSPEPTDREYYVGGSTRKCYPIYKFNNGRIAYRNGSGMYYPCPLRSNIRRNDGKN